MTEDPIARAAQEADWLRLAARIEDAISRRRDLGLSSETEVLTVIGERRGQSATTLRLPVRAKRFLQRCFAEALEGGRVQTGYTHVNVLKSIHEYDPGLAYRIADDVFADRVRLEQLRATLREVRLVAEHGSPGPGRGGLSDPRLIGKHFKRLVEQHLRLKPEVFCPGHTGPFALKKDGSAGLFSFDFVLTSNEEPVSAIECKSFSAASTFRHLEHILCYLDKSTNYIENAWLLVPEANKEMICYARDFATSVEMKKLRLAYCEYGSGEFIAIEV